MTKHEFNADVNQLIQLVTHSIYSNKEVFLRELVSNASDALAKAKIKSLQDNDYLSDDHSLQITIDVDKEKNTITIKDNGIGMTKNEVIENIGTIAKSGTKKFLESLKQQKNENNLIGQFGIGFYSVFMVAKKVHLETKAQNKKAILWKSNGKGSYEIAESEKKQRGTTIVLFLNKDSEEFVDEHRVKSLIKKHSNYVPFPIMMKESVDEKDDKNDNKEYKQINKAQSIWTKQKANIKEKEYQEFYQSLSFDSNEPLDHIHLHIEGKINFKALLFIPQKTNPFASMMPEQDHGPQLYVQNVLIMEKCKELLPQRLRFVKGVIETPDLPLNVSREILQNNLILNKIKTTLIKKVIESLHYQQKENPESYKEFFNNYGKILKEGIHFDLGQKENIAEACLFYSYKDKKLITLNQYIQNHKKETTIYYLTGSSKQELQQSPYLEQFKNTQHDVLLMDEPIDERVVQSLQEYKNHKLINAQHANIEDNEEQTKQKKQASKLAEENKDFLAFIKNTIGGDRIDTIDFSHKLTNTVAVLVDKEGQPSIQMEKYMEAMGQQTPPTKRDFHINPNHTLVQKMLQNYKDNPKGKELKELTQYLYEQALLQQGAKVENMQAFIKRVNKLLQ